MNFIGSVFVGLILFVISNSFTVAIFAGFMSFIMTAWTNADEEKKKLQAQLKREQILRQEKLEQAAREKKYQQEILQYQEEARQEAYKKYYSTERKYIEL